MTNEQSGDLNKALNIQVLVAETQPENPIWGGQVRFHSNGVKLDNPPVVCLSRIKPLSSSTGCWFPVDNLGKHDNHAPAWHDKSAMQDYIKRVTDDISKVVSDHDGEIKKAPDLGQPYDAILEMLGELIPDPDSVDDSPDPDLSKA